MITTLSLFLVALAAEAAGPAAEATPATAENKVICRSYLVTGSLVAKRKVCHTKREWARTEQNAKDETSRMTAGIVPERTN